MAVLGSRSSRKRKLSSMSFSTEGGLSGNRSSISAARTRTRCSVRAASVTVTFHSSGPSASIVIMVSLSRGALQNTSFWRRERFFAAAARKRYNSAKPDGCPLLASALPMLFVTTHLLKNPESVRSAARRLWLLQALRLNFPNEHHTHSRTPVWTKERVGDCGCG